MIKSLRKALKITFLVLLITLPVLLFAQGGDGRAVNDSLLRELPKHKDDSGKAVLLSMVARSFFDISPDEGLKYANQALALSQNLNYKYGMAASYSVLGGVYSIKGDVNEAQKNLSLALKLYKELGNKHGAADAYIELSTVYARQDNYSEAVENALKALRLYDELKYKRGMAICYGNIGNVYADQHDIPDAIKYYNEALKILDEMGDKSTGAMMLQNLASVYSDGGNNVDGLKKSFESLKIAIEIGDKYLMLSNYINIGDMLADQKNYDEALKNYRLALNIADTLRVKMEQGIVVGNIGSVLAAQKKYNEAKPYKEHQLAIGRELRALNLIRDANKVLSEIYAHAGDYKRSLESFREYTVIKDSMFNEENTRKTVKAQMQFDFDKKVAAAKAEQEEKDALVKLKLQQKNIFIYGAVFAFLVLLVIGLLVVRHNKLKANQQRIELEQKQLRAQMNPHFIFNCLNSIQHFVVDNDVKNANKYLSGFASLMRQTLENSKEGVITLRKELVYLENYLTLELMRFEDKFTYEISYDKNVNIDSTEIPSMIIQPFIENAIRHGLCYLKDRKGKLTVRFYMAPERGGKDPHLFCEIDDNGIGREQSQKLKMGADVVYESQGMELTRQRLALVSKNSGSDYEIEVVDKKNATGEPEGTKITIKFPANT